MVGDAGLVHYRWPPRIQVTDSLFEASLEEKEDLDGDGRRACWRIRQDSKLWRTQCGPSGPLM
ncbi:MAG: hypothetical protein AB1505_09640 [Candidatus Latescibacterota bacterium]